MKNNLLIVGAGIYGALAKEIAESMHCFGKISFVDDSKTEAPDKSPVVGTRENVESLFGEYTQIVVAIGNPEIRLPFLKKLEGMPFEIVTLISPRAYVAPSAQIMKGSIIEPMATVHTGAVVSAGCIVSAGAVVGHAAVCREGVHVDCNATVMGGASVPRGVKVKSGEVYA